MFRRFNYCKHKLGKLQKKVKAAGPLTREAAEELVLWHDRFEHFREYLTRTNLALVLAMAKRTRLGDIDFAEVDYIEVTKGGADLTNQGAMAGSVNIVRKQPDSGFHLTPALQTGSFGFWNPSWVMSTGSENFQVQARCSFRRSDPFQDGSGRRMTDVLHELDDTLAQGQVGSADVALLNSVVTRARGAALNVGAIRTVQQIDKLWKGDGSAEDIEHLRAAMVIELAAFEDAIKNRAAQGEAAPAAHQAPQSQLQHPIAAGGM